MARPAGQLRSVPPANEAIVAGGVRAEVVRQIAPWRARSQDPEDAIEDATVIHSRHAARLIRQHGLDSSPFIIGEFVAHDSSSQFGSLNHRGLANRNASNPAPSALTGRSGHRPADSPLNPSKMTRCGRGASIMFSLSPVLSGAHG